MKVGFIGLGHMGQFMSRNMAKGGHEAAVYDIRPEAAAKVAETPNARAVRSIAEAADGAEIVFTSLPGPPEVEKVVLDPDGLKDSMGKGTIYVDLSSNSPSMVRRLAATMAEAGITMLDAPVSGGVEGAEAGTLSVMVGGDQAAYERVKPALSSIGTKLFYCGPIGNGSVVKLCNNISSQMQLLAGAEVLALGMKAGVDLKTLADVIAVSTGTSRAIAQTFPRQLFKRNFGNPGFSTYLSAKDTHLAIELAHEVGMPMEIGELVERDKQEALRRGWGDLSTDVYIQLLEERVGVKFEIPE